MNCPMLRFFGTFGVFGDIVRIRVEYRMLRGTHERVARLYEPALNEWCHMYRTVPCLAVDGSNYKENDQVGQWRITGTTSKTV